MAVGWLDSPDWPILTQKNTCRCVTNPLKKGEVLKQNLYLFSGTRKCVSCVWVRICLLSFIDRSMHTYTEGTHLILRELTLYWENLTYTEGTYLILRELNLYWGNWPYTEGTYLILREITLYWGNLTYTEGTYLILRELDYIMIISFEYILYCVCFNLYCGGFKLFCNVCVCVCWWVL
jgi:hypothetical protein